MPLPIRLKVAAIQLTSREEPTENVREASRWIKKAAQEGAKWIALPENFALMSDNPFAIRNFAKKGGSKQVLEQIAALAKELSVHIVAGSVPLQAPHGRKLTNSSVIFGPSGKTMGRYDKIHLFDVNIPGSRRYQESLNFAHGKKPLVIKSGPVRAGISICYDVRFSDVYLNFIEARANLIFLPSAFTVPTGEAHWDLLTRGRAIETQSFLIAPAQSGQHSVNRKTYGHSRIIDPWGRVLTEISDGPGCIVEELDFSILEDVRANLPLHAHRRLRR